MHELSIALGIVEVAAEEARRRRTRRLPDLADAPLSEQPPSPFVPLSAATVEDRKRIEAARLYAAARALEDQRSWPEAVALLQEAAKLDPESVAISRRLCRIYVGALGRCYGPNPDRGLYKTTDGGKTWQKVLYLDDKTGVIDMRMSPADPETLLVALWERRRDEYDAHSGEPPMPEGYDGYDPIEKWGPHAGRSGSPGTPQLPAPSNSAGPGRKAPRAASQSRTARTALSPSRAIRSRRPLPRTVATPSSRSTSATSSPVSSPTRRPAE